MAFFLAKLGNIFFDRLPVVKKVRKIQISLTNVLILLCSYITSYITCLNYIIF